MANIIELFTVDGPVRIDSHQLARRITGDRKQLTIYTRTGKLFCDTVRGQQALKTGAGTTVHIDNLFASRELAEADSARVWAMIRGKAAA